MTAHAVMIGKKTKIGFNKMIAIQLIRIRPSGQKIDREDYIRKHYNPSDKNEYNIGIAYHPDRLCFRAQIQSRAIGVLYIGVFDTLDEARAARQKFIYNIHAGMTVKESLVNVRGSHAKRVLRSKKQGGTPRKKRSTEWGY